MRRTNDGTPLALGAAALLAAATAARGSRATRGGWLSGGKIPTGLGVDFDAALGGGWPSDRVVEILGPAGVAQDVALHAIAAAQRDNLATAFIDAGHTFDPAMATKLGVELNDLLIAQPESLQQALEITKAIARSGPRQMGRLDLQNRVDLVVVSLGPIPTAPGGPDVTLGRRQRWPAADTAGVTARLMSRALREITAITSHRKVLVMFTRDHDLELGNALKFYASIRVQIMGEPGDYEALIIKNKLAQPFQRAPLPGLASGGSRALAKPKIRFSKMESIGGGWDDSTVSEITMDGKYVGELIAGRGDVGGSITEIRVMDYTVTLYDDNVPESESAWSKDVPGRIHAWSTFRSRSRSTEPVQTAREIGTEARQWARDKLLEYNWRQA